MVHKAIHVLKRKFYFIDFKELMAFKHSLNSRKKCKIFGFFHNPEKFFETKIFSNHGESLSLWKIHVLRNN